MEKIAIKGSIWIAIGYGSSQLLRLISNLILTRLLVPEIFGLMALINTFLAGLQLFSDVGIKPSIIRSSRGEEEEFLNTAWTIQFIRGFGIWICCLIIANPVARFYDDPRLVWLIPITSVGVVITGFNSTSLATLNRDLDVKKVTITNLIVRITQVSVMVILAYFHASIWALIIGDFASKIVNLYISHRISKIKNRFVWDKEAVNELMSFGRWIFLSTAMTFLAGQSDRLILSKFLSLSMLGVYAISLNFAQLPKNILSKLNTQIIFPVFAKK